MWAIHNNENLTTTNRNLALPITFDIEYSPYSIVGSCNGLLCISFDNPNRFALWNPATNEFEWVPIFDLRTPSLMSREGFPYARALGSGLMLSIIMVKFASFYYMEWGDDDQLIWENLRVKAVVFSWKTWV
ncbi:hypothetical protein LINPERHAP1_LOCUS26468 [Linum perenne]